MKEVRCADAGVDCDFVARGKTEEELFARSAEHGKKAHDMEKIPPELIEKVRPFIRYASAKA